MASASELGHRLLDMSRGVEVSAHFHPPEEPDVPLDPVIGTVIKWILICGFTGLGAGVLHNAADHWKWAGFASLAVAVVLLAVPTGEKKGKGSGRGRRR